MTSPSTPTSLRKILQIVFENLQIVSENFLQVPPRSSTASLKSLKQVNLRNYPLDYYLDDVEPRGDLRGGRLVEDPATAMEAIAQEMNLRTWARLATRRSQIRRRSVVPPCLGRGTWNPSRVPASA